MGNLFDNVMCPREGGDPGKAGARSLWVPAFAGTRDDGVA